MCGRGFRRLNADGIRKVGGGIGGRLNREVSELIVKKLERLMGE